MIYLYEKSNNINFDYTNFGIEFWKKKDNITIDNDYIPFKLIQRYNNNQLAIIYCKNIEEAVLTYANRKNIPIENFLFDYFVIK